MFLSLWSPRRGGKSLTSCWLFLIKRYSLWGCRYYGRLAISKMSKVCSIWQRCHLLIKEWDNKKETSFLKSSQHGEFMHHISLGLFSSGWLICSPGPSLNLYLSLFLCKGIIRTALPNMDREVKEVYQVLIQAKDMGGQLGGLAGTTTINITLGDVNDNPPRFTKSEH